MKKILAISIAAYNVEDYIQKALDSIIDDEIMDKIEIFVIDDGGNDSTLQIAQKYAQRYPNSIFCIHKDNGGYGSTINTSIDLATAKYFKQLDGDDWFHHENMRDFLEVLEKTSADCVLSYYSRYYEADNRCECRTVYDYISEGDHNLDDSGIHDQLSMYTATFSTDILKKMPERITEKCFYTDAEFSSYPLLYINTLCVFHRPIYVYRIGREGQSMSADGVRKHYKEHEIVFWNLLRTYNKISEKDSVKKKMMLYKLRISAIEQFKFYCVLPVCKESFQEMKNFEKKVNAADKIILKEAKKKSKFVRLLLSSRFLMYPFIREWVIKGL